MFLREISFEYGRVDFAPGLRDVGRDLRCGRDLAGALLRDVGGGNNLGRDLPAVLRQVLSRGVDRVGRDRALELRFGFEIDGAARNRSGGLGDFCGSGVKGDRPRAAVGAYVLLNGNCTVGSGQGDVPLVRDKTVNIIDRTDGQSLVVVDFDVAAVAGRSNGDFGDGGIRAEGLDREAELVRRQSGGRCNGGSRQGNALSRNRSLVGDLSLICIRRNGSIASREAAIPQDEDSGRVPRLVDDISTRILDIR